MEEMNASLLMFFTLCALKERRSIVFVRTTGVVTCSPDAISVFSERRCHKADELDVPQDPPLSSASSLCLMHVVM